MTSRVPCPNCGYENSSHRTLCKQCKVNLEDARLEAEYEAIREQADTAVELPLATRSELLSVEITRYVRQGYRVVSRTGTSAQLVKPKEFSLFWAIVGFLLLYLLYYLSKKDETVYLEVLPNGRIVRT